MTYPMEDLVVLDLSQIYNGPYATFLMAHGRAHGHQDRAAGRREPAPPGRGGRRRPALRHAQLEQAIDAARSEDRARQGRCSQALVDGADVAGRELRARRHGSARARRRGAAQAEPAPRLRARVRATAGPGPYAQLPRHGPDRAGHVRRDDRAPATPTGRRSRPGRRWPTSSAACIFMARSSTALYERERTGIGAARRGLDAGSRVPLARSNLGLHYSKGNPEPPRTGNRHGGLAEAPYNVYPTADGYIAMICVGEAHWQALTDAMQRPDLADDPRFSSLKERVADMDAIDELVAALDLDPVTGEALRPADGRSRAMRAGAQPRRGDRRSAHARGARARSGSTIPSTDRSSSSNRPSATTGCRCTRWSRATRSVPTRAPSSTPARPCPRRSRTPSWRAPSRAEIRKPPPMAALPPTETEDQRAIRDGRARRRDALRRRLLAGARRGRRVPVRLPRARWPRPAGSASPCPRNTAAPASASPRPRS